MPVPTLLVTGPVGSDKSTVAFEMSTQLGAAGVAHAVVDTDELDRIFPPPADDPHKTLLTRRNLAAVWANLRAAGASRLILVMVAASLGYELPHLREAVPGAQITTVRLRASEGTLLERLRRREVGSGLEHYSRRAIEQARLMAREGGRDGLLVVETTAKTASEVAREVLCGIGGGSGHLLRAILDAAPNARGVLFDLAHVIEEAGIASERLTFPAGDFFRDELPACDAYLLMEISTTGETKSPPPSSGRFGGPPRRAPGCW